MRNALILCCIVVLVCTGCRGRRQEKQAKADFCDAMAALDDCTGFEGIDCDDFWSAIVANCELTTLPLSERTYEDCLNEHVESMQTSRDECLAAE